MGKWSVRDDHHNEFFEDWTTDGEQFSGEVYRMDSGGKKIIETMRIHKQNNEWIYEADVPENDQVVLFKMKKMSNKKVEFENTEYDFPMGFIYEKSDVNDEMIVTTLGKEGTQVKKISFLYKKIGKNE